MTRWHTGTLAAAWGALFAVVSLYWILGGDIGVDQLGVAIQEDVDTRPTAFLVTFWLGVVAKAVWAVLGWSLARSHGQYRRLHLMLGWASAIGLTAYGGLGTIEKALMQAGAIDVSASIGEDALIWYLLLWDPYWLLGGLLFLAATWTYQKETQ